MLLDSFFRYLDSHGPRTRARHPRRHAVRPGPNRLVLERLEDRALPSFLAPRAFDTGAEPIEVTVRDINGDGLADLAVLNLGSFPDYIRGVSVHLGKSDGTFEAARRPADELAPDWFEMEDFNGDGRLDLAVVSYSYGLNMLLGNGDGTFQPAQRVGDLGFSTVGDFNGDGRLDLAGQAVAGTEYVLLGNGDGTFQPPRYFSLPVAAYIRGPGDFNGDGRLDLTVGEGRLDLAVTGGPYGGNPSLVSLHLGNGDGTLQAAPSYPAGTTGLGVTSGDFNGDGGQDLVNDEVILLGNGDGTFRAARPVPAGGYAKAVGDFNGDGRLDLATASGANRLSVLLGNGDGSFRLAGSFAVGISPVSVEAGDVNGDGWLDLAVANWRRDPSEESGVFVLLSNGDGTFQAARQFLAGRGTHSVVAEDVNGDGLLDLAVANRDNVSVLLGNGDGTFQTARHFAAINAGTLVAGDVNGDGRLDLVVGSYSVRVLLGNGDGTFQTTPMSYVTAGIPASVALADFNGDGWLDAATANLRSNDVSILLNAADDAAFFYVYAPESVPAGQPFDLTVYALSADWQRLAHGYRGTVAFWSSDEAATLPKPYAFRPEDGGIASFPGGVTLRTPGVQELYAFDLETFTVFGVATIEVTGGAGPGFPGEAGPALDLFITEVLLSGSRPARR